MAEADLTRRVFAAYSDYLALGNRVRELDGMRVVSNPNAPSVHDANFAVRVRAQTPEQIDAVLRAADTEFAGLRHRRYMLDADTPEAFVARLVLDDYSPKAELQGLLEGELRARPRKLDIRPVECDADWDVVRKLTKLDQAESAAREGRSPYTEEVSRGLLNCRRAKAPSVRTWLARERDTDCAYFSSWPGNDGVGKVEDLYTLPEFRHRGIATALIAHCVDDARARGAGPVIIGSAPDDTPKHMYAALGFRPFAVQRAYLKTGLTP